MPMMPATRISAHDATKTNCVFGPTAATKLSSEAPNVFGFTRRKFSSVRSVPRFSETNSQPWSCHFAFALLSLPRSACTDLNSYCTLSSACRLPEPNSVSSVVYPGGAIDIGTELPRFRPRPGTRVANFLAIRRIGRSAASLSMESGVLAPRATGLQRRWFVAIAVVHHQLPDDAADVHVLL